MMNETRTHRGSTLTRTQPGRVEIRRAGGNLVYGTRPSYDAAHDLIDEWEEDK